MAAPMQLRPAMLVHGSSKSSFRGLTTSFQQLNVSQGAVGRTAKLQVEGEFDGRSMGLSILGTQSIISLELYPDTKYIVLKIIIARTHFEFILVIITIRMFVISHGHVCVLFLQLPAFANLPEPGLTTVT